MEEPIIQYSNIQPLVQKEIDDKITAYAAKSQYNVADIPAHTHNGVDSGRIDASDLDGNIGSYVPITRTVNGHALSADVTVTNADLGAVPTTTTVNGHALSGNVTVTASDLGLSQIYLGALASNNLQDSLDTERTINGNASGYPKSIKVNRSGSIRLKVDAHTTSGYNGQTGFIYKNGVNVQQLSPTTSSYATYSADINVIFGDTIQIYVPAYGSAIPNFYVKNFRLYYDDVILTSIPDGTLADTNL